MDSKQKAQEIFTTYRFALSIKNAPLGEQKDLIAKKCALIAVDEIMKLHCLTAGWQEGTNLPLTNTMRPYWQEVKNEINNL